MSLRAEQVLLGGLAGVVGAACMTPLRIVARRWGLIERTVPQAMEAMLANKLGRGHDAPPAAHHVADHALHFGYGATLGLAYGTFLGGRHRRSGGIVARGLGFGVATWLLGSGVVVAATRAARPLWRAQASEHATDLAAHLVFGLATALVCDDLADQRSHGPKSRPQRLAARVG